MPSWRRSPPARRPEGVALTGAIRPGRCKPDSLGWGRFPAPGKDLGRGDKESPLAPEIAKGVSTNLVGPPARGPRPPAGGAGSRLPREGQPADFVSGLALVEPLDQGEPQSGLEICSCSVRLIGYQDRPRSSERRILVGVYTARSFTYSQAFAQAIVAAYLARPAAALIAAPDVHLFKANTISPTPQSVAADFAAGEADYTGYALTSPTLTGPANLSTQIEGAVTSTTFLISAGPVTVTNVIGGYWIQQGSVVVGYEVFVSGQTQTMAAIGDYIALNLALPVMEFQSVS
jgi:hypothetical protein